jgi:Sulfotransferase family
MIEGFLGQVLRDQAMGWAYDSDRPNAHVAIDIYCGERHLGSTIANIYRPDLAHGRIGEGDHAFLFHYPTELEQGDLTAVVARARSERDPLSVRELPRFFANRPSNDVRAAPGVPVSTYHDDTQFPVFVLGAPRSGTSAVAQALMASTQYVGHYEGQVLDLLTPMLHTLRRFYESKSDDIILPERLTMIKKIPEEYFTSGISALFADAVRGLFPTGRWCDKTPTTDMIWAAPHLARIWPNAKFVFLKRRGLENLLSRMRKFRDVPFEGQCLYWTACMEAWRAVRDNLTGRALELDQHFLARHQEQSAAAIGKILALAPEQVNALAVMLSKHRPERTSADVLDISDLSSVPWDTAQRAIFDRVCGPTMAAYGYSFDKDYYAPGAEGRSCVMV